MYKATFNFPDSLATAATSFSQKLNVKRLIMKVDGKTVAVDSTTSFVSHTNYSLGYDYVPVNTSTNVELSVIGNLTGWSYTTDTLLFYKSDIIGAQVSGSDSTRTTTLNYVGPVTGKDNLTVTITKVGLYQITAQTLPTVIPKTVSK